MSRLPNALAGLTPSCQTLMPTRSICPPVPMRRRCFHRRRAAQPTRSCCSTSCSSGGTCSSCCHRQSRMRGLAGLLLIPGLQSLHVATLLYFLLAIHAIHITSPFNCARSSCLSAPPLMPCRCTVCSNPAARLSLCSGCRAVRCSRCLGAPLVQWVRVCAKAGWQAAWSGCVLRSLGSCLLLLCSNLSHPHARSLPGLTPTHPPAFLPCLPQTPR